MAREHEEFKEQQEWQKASGYGFWMIDRLKEKGVSPDQACMSVFMWMASLQANMPKPPPEEE